MRNEVRLYISWLLTKLEPELQVHFAVAEQRNATDTPSVALEANGTGAPGLIFHDAD